MESIKVNNKNLVCPECNKTYKNVILHLKNKHAWDVVDIFDYKTKQKDSTMPIASDVIDESQFGAHKISEIELEMDRNVRRAIDKEVMMHALSGMNGAIGAIFENAGDEDANYLVGSS